MADRLAIYRAKRDFSQTAEPQGGKSGGGYPRFVVQKHDATRLHYDFRLEMEGVLVSWAVTKGPSMNPKDKRLAVRTEDHPLDYGSFEGIIPKGQYGGGTVMLWDEGNYALEGNAEDGLKEGKLKFVLNGARLKGGFTLVRMRNKKNEKRENWLLIKENDHYAKSAPAIDKWQRSVKTGHTMSAIAKEKDAVWRSSRPADAASPEKTTAPAKKKSETKQKSRVTAKSGRPAKNARPPSFAPPQLATLTEGVPEGDWIFETKFDGYRMLAAVSGAEVICYTRSGKDWTQRFQPLADAIAGLDLGPSLLDGEVVVANESGRPDFSALQDALKEGASGKLRYVIFDAQILNGEDLRKGPFSSRRKKMERAFKVLKAPLALSEQLEGPGTEIRAEACRRGWEGLIAKRPDAPYRPKRTTDWLKVKCTNGEEFVIGGWSPSPRGRSFSSLLLGVWENGVLTYRGRVGTGFSDKTLVDLSAELKKRSRKTSPFVDVPADIARKAKWVTPELVAEIHYAELTSSAHVRHGVFMGLREDKKAIDVTGDEKVVTPKKGTAKVQRTSEDAAVSGVRLTHPDKILFPSMGITKRALAEYYAAMAPRILPFAAQRPLSLLRCPEGEGKECFFQKHAGTYVPEQIKRIPIAEKKGGEKDYLLVSDAGGLVACAQMGVLELHGWGSRNDKIEYPDRMVFDLDPAEELTFDAVKAAAKDLAAVLRSSGLESWPLVTGGKGIHLVIPLDRKSDWQVVGDFAKDFADKMEELDSSRFIANMSKAKRKGRIFLDYLRNRRGATAIVPYSPRAREGAPVAMPVTWKSLSKIKSANAFSLKDALAAKSDPWSDMKGVKYALTKKVSAALGL